MQIASICFPVIPVSVSGKRTVSRVIWAENFGRVWTFKFELKITVMYLQWLFAFNSLTFYIFQTFVHLWWKGYISLFKALTVDSLCSYTRFDTLKIVSAKLDFQSLSFTFYCFEYLVYRSFNRTDNLNKLLHNESITKNSAMAFPLQLTSETRSIRFLTWA